MMGEVAFKTSGNLTRRFFYEHTTCCLLCQQKNKAWMTYVIVFSLLGDISRLPPATCYKLHFHGNEIVFKT